MSNTDNERTRTYSWRDPGEMLALFKGNRPLDVLRATLESGRPLAPMLQTVGAQLTEVTEGRAVFTSTPSEYHYNPAGVVHGGMAATLLDSAMGIAVLSSLPAGMIFTTLELKVNFLRAMTTTTGEVRAEGNVVHLGRTTAVVEARLTDATGKLLATASSTCLIMPLDRR
ncbi:MAG TPA: PaaI family thioesterase [Ktedonobacterales bacterium]|nr:PaaI family thioesterase [Ktedonobacterales bacterium]